ncbi:MAG: hypothetical protein D6796_09500, partial [Caldilineae bacterium]
MWKSRFVPGFIGATAIVLALAACGRQTVAPRPDALWVDAAAPGVNISPYVYGVNHGPWAFMDADML